MHLPPSPQGNCSDVHFSFPENKKKIYFNFKTGLISSNWMKLQYYAVFEFYTVFPISIQ